MRKLKGFSNYLIYEDGRVFSLKRNVFLKQSCTDRYLRVSMTDDNGKKWMKSSHRVIALAYVPNPNNKPTVNHIDGDKHNNHASNLEWLTQEENQRHADLMGLNKVKGIDNPTFKPWYFIKDGVKQLQDSITIKDWCDLQGASNNYSNVKKWCRKNHTLTRGQFKGVTFGYCS